MSTPRFSLRSTVERLSLTSLLLLLQSANAQVSTPESTTRNPDEPVALSAFQVSASGDRGYAVTNSLGASRIALPIGDISTSVATLNRAFQDDLGAMSIIDATRYVSGVDMAAPLSETWSQRGTNNQITTLDGVPDNAAGSGNRERYAGILTERIEVIKGPVGTLYGSHAAGGLVNRVSKMPLPVARTELLAAYGSRDQKIASVDTTGPVDAKKKLLYRLIAEVRDGDYQVKGYIYDEQLISPMLSYALTPTSKVWVRANFRYEQRPNEGNENWFLDAKNNLSYFIPRDRSLDNKDVTFRTWFRGYEAGYDRSFTTGKIEWATRVITRYNNTDGTSIQYTRPTYSFIDATGAVLGTQTTMLFSDPRWTNITYLRNRRERGDSRAAFIYNWDLSAKFDLGFTKQWALTYFQGGRDSSSSYQIVYPYAPSNIANPVYFGYGKDGITGAATSRTQSAALNNNFSWGAHDNIFLLDKKVIVAGGTRFDHVESKSTNLISNATTFANNKQWSYKGGVIGKPYPGVSLFYNWSQTFTPVNTIDSVTGEKFPNQVATINEAGFKVDLLENRVVGTVSYFDTKQKNVVISVHDPVTGLSTLVPVGRQEVEGWEADINAQPLDSLDLKIGIGSIDKARTEAGLPPRWVGIGFNYKGFAKYSFRRGALKGLAVGAGVVYTNKAAGDATASFILPPHAVGDALMQYTHKQWTVQLNVFNFTDKAYPITAVDRTLIYSGEPRTYRLTWRYKL